MVRRGSGVVQPVPQRDRRFNGAQIEPPRQERRAPVPPPALVTCRVPVAVNQGQVIGPLLAVRGIPSGLVSPPVHPPGKRRDQRRDLRRLGAEVGPRPLWLLEEDADLLLKVVAYARREVQAGLSVGS